MNKAVKKTNLTLNLQNFLLNFNYYNYTFILITTPNFPKLIFNHVNLIDTAFKQFVPHESVRNSLKTRLYKNLSVQRAYVIVL